MALVIITMFQTAFLGAVVGIIWAFGLGAKISSGVIIGVLSGAVVGLILGIIGKAASSSGNFTDREISYVSGVQMTLIAMVCGVIGILVWVIRAIFF